MTRIDLITGILGSGKTTFLMKYAKYLLSEGKRIAILENDFGAVNVDMMILQEIKSENCQLEMIAGTADPCCHKRRFKTQLISLGMQHFDCVIVEPSGIFDMDEFFDLLHEPPLDNWFSIGSIIGIADAGTENQLTEQMEYLFASEASCCGKILLSKTKGIEDINDISKKILLHLNRSLAEIRCDRQLKEEDIIAKDWNDFTKDDFKIIMSAGYKNSSYIKKFAPKDILSTVHYFMHIQIPDNKINETIENIINDKKCGEIFRLKGTLHSEKQGWLKINATPMKIEITPVNDGQAVIIVIGDNIKVEIIDKYLKKYNSDAEYVSI